MFAPRRQRVRKAKPGEWILGHGWNQNVWGIGRPQLAESLFAKQPRYLTAKSLHASWANTAALKTGQCYFADV